MARHPELLIPASSLEVLKTAVMFGADAVYIGGEAFGLRAKAKNFSMEDMREGIAFAHEHDVKVYVTANILTQITVHLIFGISLAQPVWLQRENCLWRRSERSVQIFRMIWRLRHLYMVQCVFLIQDAAF